jgi:ribosomal protein S18 acetylase RimI-like enzyme
VAGAGEQLREGSGSVIIGAFAGDKLVGAVGLLRSRHAKSQHKVHLWGMYVAPEFRRRHLATDLMRAALEHALTLPGVCVVQLGVTSAAVAARHLYEQFGFRTWGIEPDALRHETASVAEHHMFLRISA